MYLSLHLLFQTKDLEDSIDQTYVVSAQSLTQQTLIAEHAADRPVFVEGGFTVWLRAKSLTYFVLQSECTDKFQKFNISQKEDKNNAEGECKD